MPIRRSLALILLAALCTAALAQSLRSQPLEPLLETPLVPSEVSATSATLAITTRIDLACVVVYGPDETFGLLALDQAMGASAHRDHRVVLRGLQPDSEVVFRLQGSDPQGNFYASETVRFRTPPAEESADLGTNVATLERGATVVAASSEFGSAFAARNAIDDDPASEWSSQGDGNDASLTIELPERVQVSGFGVWTRTMGSSAQIRSFEIENEAGQRFGPFELPDANGLFRFPVEGEGQRFTFRVLDSSGGNTGLVELAIYSPSAP